MSWCQWALLGLIAALRVAGQSSNVTSCIPDYDWSINTKGQTPCLVASFLESQCGEPTSVNAIPNNTHYLGPTFALQDPCLCNSVTYSMVSACGGCQGRTFQNWTAWSQFCPTPLVGTFPSPIPSNIEVPEWAFINVTLTDNNFNPTVAQAVIAGNPPPTTNTSILPTSSSTLGVATNSAEPLTTGLPDTPADNNTKSKSNAGAIAGGVIGGLVVVVLIGLYFLWRHVQKRRNAGARGLIFNSTALVSGPGNVLSHTTGGTALSSQSAPVQPASIVGPYGTPSLYTSHYGSEMGTAPPPTPATTGVYTTLSPGPTRRSLESVSPSMVQLGGNQHTTYQGAYRGTAEVS